MIPPPRHCGGGTRAPALTYAARVLVLSNTWSYLNVVVLWCRAVWFQLSSSRDVACVVVRSTAWRLSSQQAHPPSTRTRDSGQGRRLIDRLGTFTRLTRVARLRESAIFFASPVGNSTCDVRSHLFSTRSLLTPSETRLSISLVQVFTLLNDSLSVTPKTMVISCALFRLSMCVGILN